MDSLIAILPSLFGLLVFSAAIVFSKRANRMDQEAEKPKLKAEDRLAYYLKLGRERSSHFPVTGPTTTPFPSPTLTPTPSSDFDIIQALMEDYNKIIELYPNNARLLLGRGNTYSHLGQYPQAIQDYNKTIELDPNNALAYNNLGVVYLKQQSVASLKPEEYKQTIRNFSRAIELNPEYFQVYVNRGIVYVTLGYYQQGIEDYNRAIELDPNCTSAYYNRSIVYAKLGQHQQAIQDYNRIIELSPNSTDAYYNRSLAYENLGVYDQAMQDFIRTTELDPQYFSARCEGGEWAQGENGYYHDGKRIRSKESRTSVTSYNSSYEPQITPTDIDVLEGDLFRNLA